MNESSAMVFHVEDWELWTHGDGKPRVRGIDLGERLEIGRPSDTRKKIRELEQSGELTRVFYREETSRQRVGVGTGERLVKVDEPWLDEEQMWIFCMHVRTQKAREVRLAIARAMVEVRRQIESSQRSRDGFLQRLLDAVLQRKELPPADWERMFPDSLVRALCILDGYEWNGGSHPPHLRSTNRKIYDTVFSSEVGRALKARCPQPSRGNNFHQHLTTEARAYFRDELRVAEAIADQSASKSDFWLRMDRRYRRGMLQLEFT